MLNALEKKFSKRSLGMLGDYCQAQGWAYGNYDNRHGVSEYATIMSRMRSYRLPSVGRMVVLEGGDASVPVRTCQTLKALSI